MIDLAKIDAAFGGPTREGLRQEVLFALGAEYVYEGMTLPQPTAGTLALLDCIDSPIVCGGEITDADVSAAVLILARGKAALGAVMDHAVFGRSINYFAEIFVAGYPEYMPDVARHILGQFFDIGLGGFRMLPKGADADSKPPMVFTAEWLTAYVAACREVTGYDADRVIWEMPVCLGGFCLAVMAKKSGVKNVDRPRDDAAGLAELRRQMEADNVG